MSPLRLVGRCGQEAIEQAHRGTVEAISLADLVAAGAGRRDRGPHLGGKDLRGSSEKK